MQTCLRWEVHWPFERSTNIFHRPKLPQPKRSKVGFLARQGTHDPSLRSKLRANCMAAKLQKCKSYGLAKLYGGKIAKPHILWLGKIVWQQNCKTAHFMAWLGFLWVHLCSSRAIIKPKQVIRIDTKLDTHNIEEVRGCIQTVLMS